MADERIERLSEKLHLPDVPALLGALAQEAAAKEWSYSGFTEVLLQAQADAADARAADTIQWLAGFPVRKTLDEFDYSFQPSVNKKQVARLASCAFVERAENVVLLGPPGAGKTHLAIGLGAEAAKRRMQVKSTTAARFVASLSEARTAGTFSRRLQSIVRPRLLIDDEVGFLPLDAGEASLLVEVLPVPLLHRVLRRVAKRVIRDPWREAGLHVELDCFHAFSVRVHGHPPDSSESRILSAPPGGHYGVVSDTNKHQVAPTSTSTIRIRIPLGAPQNRRSECLSSPISSERSVYECLRTEGGRWLKAQLRGGGDAFMRSKSDPCCSEARQSLKRIR